MKKSIFNRVAVTMIAALFFACDSKVDLLVDQEANVEQDIPAISVPETFFTSYYDYYPLMISVQNTSGDNLLEGIEYDDWTDGTPYKGENGLVKKDLYTLDIIYPDPLMSPFESSKMFAIKYKDVYIPDRENVPELVVAKFNEFYCLMFLLRSMSCMVDFDIDAGMIYSHDFISPADKIKILLKCPFIFGDDNEHVINSYWKPTENSYVQACYRLDFDDKEESSFKIIHKIEDHPVVENKKIHQYYATATVTLGDL